MDTSNNRQDFTIDGLLNGTPEEIELAQKASSVMEKVISNLKPILRYISTPLPVLSETDERIAKCATRPLHIDHKDRGIRLLILGNRRYRTVFWEGSNGQYSASGPMEEFLFLGEDGAFFVAYSCPYEEAECPSHYHYKSRDPEVWHKAPFQAVISALRVALAEAGEKREQHLTSIREHSTKLDQIMEILKQ